MTLPVSLILQPSITPWSRRAEAFEDLLGIFGSAMDHSRARKWLRAFAKADFSELPPVITLAAEHMPGLWGGYSREKNRIYLSADCPPEHLAEVLIEEVGHFLDRELCASETLGEEGARFAAMVLGEVTTSEQLAAWAADEGLGWVSDEGGAVIVEGAKKKSGGGGKKKNSARSKSGGSSGKSKKKRARQPADSSDAGESSEPIGNRPPKPSDFGSMDLESVQSYDGQTLYSSKAHSTFVVSSLNVQIAGNLGGIDTIKTEVNGFSLSNFPEIENLILTGEGHITGEGNAASNLLTGNRGSNTLSGSGGNDSLVGHAGNDSLDGGAGDDSMVGGTGDDTYVVDSVGDLVVENAGEGIDVVQSAMSYTPPGNVENLVLVGTGDINGTGNALDNSLIGNSGANVIVGDAGHDTLSGDAGHDTLLGGTENDSLIGGAGNDSMLGGEGNDTYVVDAAEDVVVEGDNDGIDEVQASVNQTLSANLERLVLTGSATTGVGNLLANTLTGNLLANSLDGGEGMDSLVGGVGNDTYFVNSAGDSVFEKSQEGNDLVFSTVSYTLGADVEVERLTITGTAVSATGNSLANTLTGNLLSNSLDGGAGSDSLIGGSGNDTYFVNSPGDAIFEKAGEGEDTAFSSVNHTLAPNVENLVLTGSAVSGTGNASANKITGNRGNNLLTGLGGDDTLLGGVGDDTLVVNVSDLDSVDGGEDNDTLRFVSNSGINLSDANFGRFLDIEAFDFGGLTGDVAVTLGLNAQNLGISTVHGGAGNNTLSASAYTAGITLNASRNTGAGATGSTLVGGAAGDHLILSSHNVVNISSLVGGGGNDTLSFGENGISLTDDKFTPARISSVEVLQTKDGTNDIQIGTQAAASGLRTLVGGAGADHFDASDFNGSLAIVAGAGEDDVTLRSAAIVGTSTVAGGLGIDSLSLAEAGTLTDAQLANINGVEVLSAATTGNSSFALGVNARVGGIRMVSGGNGNDILDAGAFTTAITLQGGAGDDSLALSIAGNLGPSSVGGGTGTDTLSITMDDGSVADTDFAKVSMVEVFKTANGNNRVTLGAYAQRAGIATVVGGSGKDTLDARALTSAITIDGGQGDNSLFGGAGNDSLRAYDGADVLDGGAGADTMVGGKGNDSYYVGENGDWVIESELTGAGTNYIIVQGDVSSYTTVNGGSATFIVDALAVQFGTAGNDTLVGTPLKDTISGLGGDDVITGANGADSLMGDAGNDSISGGGGADTILGGDNNDTLLGDAGADSIEGGNGTDSILGGADNDTLLGDGGNDTIFGEAGNDSILGGADADSLIAGTGTDTLLGEAGNDTLVADATGNASLLGGDDNDSFLFSSGAQIANSTVVGGAGTDTLVLTATSTITDAQLVNVSGVEAIQASSLAGNSITLGANALASGVSTLKGGTAGGDMLSATGYTASNAKITIDASGSTFGSTLIAGLGDPAFTGGNTLLGGGGGDLIQVATAAVLNNASIVGGNGTDTVQVTTDSQVVSDTDLDRLFGGEAIQLANGANSITLGDKARGIATVAGGLDIITTGSGSDTLTATSAFGATGITLDGGAGDDRFAFDSAAQIAAATLVGGDGTDTLALGQATVLGNDDAFQKVTGMEVLQAAATGQSSFVLDSDAQAAGIRTVIGGSGKGTLNASAYSVDVTLDASANANTTVNNGATLLGGSGNNSFRLLNNNVLGVSSIVGGGASDTLSFTQDGLSITDGNFTRVQNVEALRTGNGSNYVNLAGNSNTAGIKTLVGGTGADTVAATSFSGASLVIDSGNGADFITGSSTAANSILSGAGNDSITLANAAAVGRSTVVGGADTDTLSLAGYDALTDAQLANVSEVEVLRAAATGNSSLTVGANAQAVGLRTVLGGGGNDTLNAVAFTAGVTLNGGAGNDSLLVSSGAILGQSSVVGGIGTDTIALSIDALSITDSDLTSVSTVEVLQTANGDNWVLLGANAQTAGLVTLVGGADKDTLDATAFTRTLVLDGGQGDNSLFGGAGNDSLISYNGADALDGGAGIDTMIGGKGNDTYYLSDDDEWIIENEVTGAGANHIIVQDNVSSYNTVTGGGDATFVVNALSEQNGTANDDLLVGTPLKDTISGAAGNDTIIGANGTDSLMGDDGNDSISGGGGADTILGGDDNDTLLGDAGTDSIEGGAGTDSILGGADNDTILGGDDNDTLLGDAGADSIEGGNGTDSILGGADNDTLLGEDGNDTIFGEAGNDSILGGLGDDSLIAGTGTDTLLGEVGNDTLVADATGSASLLGGDNDDSFLFSSGTQLGNNTVVGGTDVGRTDIDRLVLTAAAAVTDTQLANVSEVEIIQASSLEGNSITLGVNAQAGGVLSLFGGASSDLLSAAGMVSGNIWIRGDRVGGSSTLGDTLVAGTGTSRATLFGNNNANVALSANYFRVSVASLLGNNSIVGGASSIDYLQITNQSQTLSDSSFSNISGLDGIIFDNPNDNPPFFIRDGGHTITLGALAETKFGATISLVGGIQGGDTIDLSGTTKKVWVNATLGGLGDTITAGANDNTLVGGAGAFANDLFIFNSESHLNGASIVGGGGTDTLRLSANGQTVTTAALDKISSVEVFDLAGAGNNITLGDISAGIFTIFGGTGPNTFDASGYSTAPNSLTWNMNASNGSDSLFGGLNGNLFQLKNGSNLQNSFITGNTGSDTIQLLAGAQTLGDNAFSRISVTEVFIDANNNNVWDVGELFTDLLRKNGVWDAAEVLTSDANGDGIWDPGDAFTDSNNNGKWDKAEELTSDANGDGIWDPGDAFTDTFRNNGAFDSDLFLETLVLGSAVTNGNSITLGTTAASKGIATVIGGTRRDTINASGFGDEIWIDASASSGARLVGSTTAPLGNTLIGGSTGGNEFVVGSLGANSIVGGSNGLDTLTFSSATTINDLVQNGQLHDGSTASISKVGTIEFNAAGNTIVLGQDALIAGIRTLVGGGAGDNGSGNTFNTSAYGSSGVLFQITDQDYLSNVTDIIGGTGVDTLKFSRDGVSVTDENVANLTNIDILRTANGNNHFLIHNDFVTAGIDSIIGGIGRDTINMSDNAIYTPIGVADMITMDMSAGSGYTLISSTDDFLIPSQGNFRWAKVIGGSVAGSVILDGPDLNDADFENMYQANIGTLFMRSGSDNTVVLGENARGSGLDTLTMSIGNDDIDVTDFLGALVVNGGGGDDEVDTSFAALANLTFTGGDGDDTLSLVGAEARSITSLAGTYEAFALEAGNNFVILANDAGLSTIFGGIGVDTISMLSNTTGINFVMDATRLGNASGFASLDGGSGLDTLTVRNVGLTFLDTQFARVGSVNWAEDIGAIENFETEDGASRTYTFASFAYAAGIQAIFAHSGDNLNAFNFNTGVPDPQTDRALNFVFDTAANAAGAIITGTVAFANDTLTLTDDAQTVADATFANITSVETLVLANGANSVTLDSDADDAGIEVVIGGSGNDALTFNTIDQTSLVFNGGAQTTFDSATISNSGANLTDAYFDDWASVERLTTANGNNDIALGANAVAGGIATVTGGTGNDTFNATAYTAAITLAGNDGNDSLLSGGGNDMISGGDDNDFLSGGTGADSLFGDAGDDTFAIAGLDALGADGTIDGGADHDTIRFTGVVSSPFDDTFDNAFENVANIEAIQLADGVSNRFHLTTGVAVAGIGTISGGTGNDTIDASSALASVSLLGGNGNDSLLGGAQGDTFEGGNGADTIISGGGADSILGGDGNDVFEFEDFAELSSIVTLDGETGQNTIRFSGAATGELADWEAVFANVSNIDSVALDYDFAPSKIVLGSNAQAAGVVSVSAGVGGNYLDASNYTIGITISSGWGYDSLLGGSGDDFLDGGTGIDKIIGTTSIAMGIGEKDTLTGSGWDYFVLGDSTNVYYNSDTQVADVSDLDYAVITAFGSASNMQLKTLDAAHAGNGYVIGGALYGAIGTSNYYLYTDDDNSGAATAGDNLIAAIDSSIALTTANLKSNYGFFVG